MSQHPVTSTDRLRKALMADCDGAWTMVFVNQLQSLATRADAAVGMLEINELKHRCCTLAKAARVGMRLLPRLRAGLALGLPDERLPPADVGLLAQATQTSMICELGWLAIEASHVDDGLAIVEAVGTLLHGRPGGSMFRIEALLVIGRRREATEALAMCLARDADPDGVAAATLASLWAQRTASRGEFISPLTGGNDATAV